MAGNMKKVLATEYTKKLRTQTCSEMHSLCEGRWYLGRGGGEGNGEWREGRGKGGESEGYR